MSAALLWTSCYLCTAKHDTTTLAQASCPHRYTDAHSCLFMQTHSHSHRHTLFWKHGVRNSLFLMLWAMKSWVQVARITPGTVRGRRVRGESLWWETVRDTQEIHCFLLCFWILQKPEKLLLNFIKLIWPEIDSFVMCF